MAPVPVDGCEVLRHGETVETTSKKHGASASADSANDAVPGDEAVRVPQDLISRTEFKNIDFRID
jgi:hypothetical protein